MGNKITVDSATMMNKVFEVIEAKKIFDIKYSQISICINPTSFVHAIIQFKDGMIKIIAHDTTMKIPIANTLEKNKKNHDIVKKISIDHLKKINFEKVDLRKYPLVNIIKKIPQNHSLFETIIVTINDELVHLYLKDKIKFVDISRLFFKIISDKDFQKYKKIKPKNINNILKLIKYVRSKIKLMEL